MKKGNWRYYAIIVISILIVSEFHASPASAAIGSWQKGISIQPRSNTDYASGTFQQSMANAVADHVNYVALVIPYYQSNIYSTDIGPGWNTPTDASLISGIQYIHSLGMKVNLKIHVESYDQQWRANINPSDRNAWFGTYGAILNKYATMGAQNGVEEITVGTELINMSANDANPTNTQNWNNLIGSVRSIFHGSLTYGANWGGPGWTDEKNRITFWSSLDYIGISAYFPLSTGTKTADAYKAIWDGINTGDIANLQRRWNKPILFTEVGYRSMDWAQYEPFNFSAGGSYDPTNQAALYEALFSYWNSYDYMQGVMLWDWSSDPNAGGNGDTNYTPQHKQAETVMATWFGTNPTPTPPPTANSFSSTVTVGSNSVTLGQAQSISATITNTGGAVSGAIVDIEVYSSTNQKVFQYFVENQQFSTGASKAYATQWTPTSADTYTVKLGVFNNNWTTNYLWNGTGAQFTASTATQPPPPPPPSNSTVNIWWPTDGAAVQGAQPFKAMVPGLMISNYTMYWQVDGGVLNTMGDSQVDYPHKEAQVDLSTWNWQPSGTYTLNFIAKDASGNTIASASIQIKH